MALSDLTMEAGKSNQRHLGTITHSSLCTEITQYTDDKENAVCNMASLVLPAFVDEDSTFNLKQLDIVARHVLLFVNRTLHQTISPNVNARYSIEHHRAVAIGVQGLADTLIKMGLPFDSDGANVISTAVQEAIHFTTIDESCNLTRYFGTYPSFQCSPTSYGCLQFDRWIGPQFSNRFNWNALKHKVKKGMANSLLTACMPTVDTSRLTGCTEGVEPLSR